MALQQFDLNRAQDTPIATLKLGEIEPIDWRRFPPAIDGSDPNYLGDVHYNWPYNGLEGDDVNVATANATGPYEPKNQGNKANMIGETLAIDVTTPRGWIGPLDPYGPPPTPTLTDLNPPSRVVAPTDDIALVLTGTNFMPSSQIEFAGNIERTTYVSPTELRTIIRGTMFTDPDPAIPVRVINGGVASNTLTFAITPA